MVDQRIATDALRAMATTSYRRQIEGPRAIRRIGTITDTDTGPPLTVTLTIGAGTNEVAEVRYRSGYSPTIGDTVEVQVVGTDLFVLGEAA